MRLIRNYFLKEFFVNFILSFLSITFVMLLGNLIKMSDLIIRKGIDAGSAFKMFLFMVPYLMGFVIPLSILLGCLLTVGRIASDNEMVAIKAGGIAVHNILFALLTVGLIFSLILVIINDKVIPKAHYESRKIIKQIGKSNPLAFIEPGVFIDNFSDFILFTQDVQGNVLKKVFIYQLGSKESNNLIYADSGEFVVDRNFLNIKLSNGFIEGPQMKYRINFQTHFMHIPLEANKSSVSRKPVDMSLKELADSIKKFEKKNINPLPLQVEFHKKISFSFSALVFVLLGFGLGAKVKHRGKSINFGICFLAALFYYLFSMLGETLAFKEILPVILSMWLGNIIFALIGGYFSYRACVS